MRFVATLMTLLLLVQVARGDVATTAAFEFDAPSDLSAGGSSLFIAGLSWQDGGWTPSFPGVTSGLLVFFNGLVEAPAGLFSIDTIHLGAAPFVYGVSTDGQLDGQLPFGSWLVQPSPDHLRATIVVPAGSVIERLELHYVALAAPTYGDVNFDGAVNIFDINTVSPHWNQLGPVGDANGDGLVNLLDINAISGAWDGPADGRAIEEPPSLLLLIAGLVAWRVVGRDWPTGRRAGPGQRPLPHGPRSRPIG